MTLLLTVAFYFILIWFGVELVRLLVRERRIERLVALGPIAGVGFYTFFLNIASFFSPVQDAFYAVLLAALLCAFLCAGLRMRGYLGAHTALEWESGGTWRLILVGTAVFVALSVGFISFRHPVDGAIMRVPTAVTMVEGNVPPVEIWNPGALLGYHYAPDLFAAASTKVTGLPIYLSYDVYRGVLSGALFLLLCSLALLLYPRRFGLAYAAGLSAFYAGSIFIFQIVRGLPGLYEKFVLGQEVASPFWFVSDAIVGEYTTPLINSLVTQHWGAMSFALLGAVLYLYFHLLEGEQRSFRSQAGVFVLAGVLLALQALVSEPNFAVLCVALAALPFGHYLFARNFAQARKIFVASSLLLLIALPAAVAQGGVLRDALVQQLGLEVGAPEDRAVLFLSPGEEGKLFKFGTPLTLSDHNPWYHPRFLGEVALVIAVALPAFFFLLRRRLTLALLFGGFSFGCILAPFIVDSDFPLQAMVMGRFFFPINLLLGFGIGVAVALAWSGWDRMRKGLVLAVLAVLMAQGLWTHAVWLTLGYPPGIGWNPDAALFVDPASMEGRAYAWAKANTVFEDPFFILGGNLECGNSGAANCFFIYNAARMAPIFEHQGVGGNAEAETSAPEKAAAFKKVSRTCDGATVRALGFKYLFVHERWPEGVEARCIVELAPTLLYQDSEGERFVRIYKLQ